MQHEIGRGHPFAQLSGHVYAHHFRRQEVNRLSKHSGFRLNSAHAPANYTETVNHRRVRVGADERVGKVDVVAAIGDRGAGVTDPGYVWLNTPFAKYSKFTW